MKNYRVLILTLSFGSGHVRASEAIINRLKKAVPKNVRLEIEYIDVIPKSWPIFRALYVWPYYAMLKYAPSLWDRFFENRVQKAHKNTAPEWAFQIGCSRVFRAINKFKPDLIVATEVGACEIGRMVKRKRPEMRLAGIVTDYEGEPIWACPEVDWFSVSLPEVGRQLIGWGAPADRIGVCGIPFDEQFGKRRTSEERKSIISDFHLRSDKPIVVMMTGGMGFTRMDKAVESVLRHNRNVQLVAITGQDVKMKRRLDKLAADSDGWLTVLGWCNRVHDLMGVADLLVTKPGGMTITEALAAGLPIVAFDPLPGAEVRHCEFIVNNGAGFCATDYEEVAAMVSKALDDRSLIRKMKIHATALAKPNATADIVDRLFQLLESPVMSLRSSTAEIDKMGMARAVATPEV